MPHEHDNMTINITHVDVPRLDQYFGVWAIDPAIGRSMFSQAAAHNWQAHVTESRNVEASINRNAPMNLHTSQTSNKTTIAMISMRGTLMKQASSMEQSTSSIRLRQQIREAVNDDSVDAILLMIDSPGGTVAGTQDLANEVIRAKASKPVVTYFEDLGASAAYWVGSSSDAVYANNKTALIGSIGTFMALYDMSGMAQKEGIKAKVYATGPLKGAGFPGAEITEEQDQYFQAMVDTLQIEFSSAVKANRGLNDKQLADVSTGGVFTAAEALAKGLIDGIQSFEQTIEATAMLVAKRNNPSQRQQQENKTMSTDTNKSAEQQNTQQPSVTANAQMQPVESVPAVSQPASFGDIKQSCTGADNDFICSQLEAGVTVAQAQQNWMAEQNRRIQAANAKSEKPGIEEPLRNNDGSQHAGGSATDQWNAAIDAKIQSNPSMTRSQATSMVAKENPELREAFVAESNAR